MNSAILSTSEELSEIFRTTGQPTVTYVERESGAFERDIDGALSERGQLCLITGPSKTGKTTLYMEVLRRRGEVPIIVRCDRSLTAKELWRQALEEIDFERVETRTRTVKSSAAIEAEASGKLGWNWLAQATAKFKGSAGIGRDDAEVREKILAEPGADALIPFLKNTNAVLVVEDFHYLPEEEKTILFEQWKRFTDSEVSVIVLGTTHRAIEIANSNKDLIGRITQINIGNWDESDLRKIAKKGFDYIGISVPQQSINMIAKESVGLPIIVQQACLTLVTRGGAAYRSDIQGRDGLVSDEAVSDALHSVANKRYAQFQDNYSLLIRGPRERARKYKTYEIILSCFGLDPIKFFLNKGEILDRIYKLGLSDSEIPKPASVQSTLTALTRFQSSRGLDLLEWQPNRQILHIVEPSFLFFVRWREKKISNRKRLTLSLSESLVQIMLGIRNEKSIIEKNFKSKYYVTSTLKLK